jgi:toxin ParE1/3/4
MGRAREEIAAGIRSFPLGQYVIFYVRVDGGIDIVRVLHSRRDLDTQFEG